MRWLLVGLFLTSHALAARYAVVVGNNHALPGSGYDRLEYADDDALRFAAFLEALGAQVHLLTVPDPDAATQAGSLRDRARSPDRQRLLEAIEAVASAARSDAEAEVYFYFSGHGSLSAASAHLHLLDGPFTRTDLHEHVLKKLSDIHRLHVIIDSCNAWFLVNARGARVAVAQDEESLDRYPQAGFLLSTSRGKEVHEWSGYRGGVFSHQLLAAMQGAADVDGDGRVHYAEAHAFLVAANLGVTDPRARIEPHVRAPAIRGATLVALPDQLTIVPEPIAGHLHIEDDRGRRLLDAHKAVGVPMRLLLPQGALRLVVADRTHLREQYGETFRFSVDPVIDPQAVARRGTLADQFRERLFLRPLTPEFVEGFRAGTAIEASAAAPLPPTPWLQDSLTLTLLGGGAALLIAGGISTPFYLDAAERADRRPVTAETDDARTEATRLQVVMASTYAAGGALLVGGLLRMWLGDDVVVGRGLVPGGLGVVHTW